MKVLPRGSTLRLQLPGPTSLCPRVSVLVRRAGRCHRHFSNPHTRSFTTTPASASLSHNNVNMPAAKGEKDAWVGYKGAAGFDLRSKYVHIARPGEVRP